MTFLRLVPVFAFLLYASTLLAQWTNVAPNLLSPSGSLGGAMAFSDGNVWAALARDLYVSTNNGGAWSKRSPGFGSFREYRDISFFDRNTGIVILSGDDPMITRDGGLTWNFLAGLPSAQFLSARFLANEQEIVVCGYAVAIPFVAATRDGGLTWTTTDLSSYASILHLQIGKNNTVYGLANGVNNNSRIIYSHDYGMTWNETPASFDYDCYSFTLDPCDTNAFYVANEELYTTNDGLSEFLFTSDRGVSWQRSLRKSGHYTTGSLVVTPGSNIYMQTLSGADGVVRSTDLGSTWSAIGGPGGGSDSRTIIAVDENTIFAIDEQGSIWRTTNSGGDSAASSRPKSFFLASKDTLFLGDSAEVCGGSATDTVRFSSGGGCTAPPAIASITTDDANYSVIEFNNDSTIITFTPKTIGNHNGSLLITFTDGTTRRIQYRGVGYGNGYTLSASADTLFASDTLLTCETSDTIITLAISGCPTPLLTSQSITGDAAGDYQIIQAAPDSLTGNNFVTIRFSPSGAGKRNAEFRITMADGADIVITLAGVGKPTYPITLATISAQFTTDTIGGLVSIPIIINGLPKKETVELTVFFDKSLDYIGTTSLSGSALDVGLPTSTSSLIRIPASVIRLGTVSAYANFNVFADSVGVSSVLFDSLRVPGAQRPCEYSSDSRISTEIINTLYPDCGISYISRFAHFGNVPKLRIFPNPASSSMMISFSGTDFSPFGRTKVRPTIPVKITVADALGSVRISQQRDLSTAKSVEMDLSGLPSGVYYVRVDSEGGVAMLPIVVKR